MKKLILFITLIFFLISSINLFAQVNTYTFLSFTGSYTEITGDTTVAFATGTETSTSESLDDVVYPNNSLPFSFNFNGTTFTKIAISSNGFITFGGSAEPTDYEPISVTTTYNGASSGIGNDLIGTRGVVGDITNGSNEITSIPTEQFIGLEVGRIITGSGVPTGTTITALNPNGGTITLSANATTSGSVVLLIPTGSIVRGTTGAIGSRIHTIQFRNIRNWTNEANANCINFQIKLYETSNIIEIVYGINNASPFWSFTGQVGLRGATNANFNNRTTSTNWAATSAGTTNSATCTMSSTVLPSSGLTFRWSLPSGSTNDVGVLAITNPLEGINTFLSLPIVPKVTIKNFGASQISPFNITCIITPGGYSSTKSDTLFSGLTRSIKFDSTFTPVLGMLYTITVYTTLASDINPLNDTLKHTSTFVFQNHGNDSGYFYANNLATNQPSYPEYFWKDTIGSKNLVLNGIQANGTSLWGSIDDGYFKLRLKDILLSLGLDTTNKRFKYNGVCFDSIFPGTNGIIGFTEKFGTTSLLEFKIDGNLVPKNALLPFWKDFDLAAMGTGTNTNRLSYKATGSELIITYDRTVAFIPITDWVSFQVIITIVTGCGSANSNFRYTYADSTTGQTSPSFVKNYLSGMDSILNSQTTFRNFVIGFSNSNLTPYAGYVSSGNPFPASPQTQLAIRRPAYNLSSKSGLAVEFGPYLDSLNKFGGSMLSLNLTAFNEGFYNTSTNTTIQDTVIVYLRNTSSPFVKVDSAKAFLSTTGQGIFSFDNAQNEIDYYIQIKHRNSIRTWSYNGQRFTNSFLNYIFSTPSTQAFGNNMVQVDNSPLIFAMYSGDVNQDGIIDASDLSEVDNDAFSSISGYVITDLNGDNFVDASDLSIVDNNVSLGIVEISPLVMFDVNNKRSIVPRILDEVMFEKDSHINQRIFKDSKNGERKNEILRDKK